MLYDDQPFAKIGNEDFSYALLTDEQQGLANPREDWSNLPGLELLPLETQFKRPLLNNPDLDPDDNFFVNGPIDHGYLTPNLVVPVMRRSDDGIIPFSLIHVNCRSLYHKVDDIRILLEVTQPTILAVTETWLTEMQNDSIIFPGYNFVHKSRSSGLGGGVGLIIRKEILFTDLQQISDFNSQHKSYEGLFINIPLHKGRNLILGAIYRPPDHTLLNFNVESISYC